LLLNFFFEFKIFKNKIYCENISSKFFHIKLLIYLKKLKFHNNIKKYKEKKNENLIIIKPRKFQISILIITP